MSFCERWTRGRQKKRVGEEEERLEKEKKKKKQKKKKKKKKKKRERYQYNGTAEQHRQMAQPLASEDGSP